MIEVSILNQGKQLKDASDLAFLSSQLKKEPNVEILTLQGNSLAPAAGKELARQIKDLSLNNIKVLNFSDLFTGRVRAEIPPTLTYIFDALMLVGCRLEKINLSDNAFGPDGAKPCVPLLKSKCCIFSLKQLYFNNNGLGAGGVVIAKALRDANIASNFTYPLEVFVAGRNRLENPGAKALGNAIIKMPNIKVIRIAQNGVRPAGLVALASALTNCKSLEVIDISDNCMTAKAAIPMAKSLANLSNLKEINFSDTLIRNRGLQALGNSLEAHNFPKLKTINIAFGEIKAKYVLKFAQTLNKKSMNISLNINGNEIGPTALEKIKSLNCISLEDFNVEDDDGSPENSTDSEAEDPLTDTEEIDYAKYELSAAYKIATEEKAEACTVTQFLAKPSGPKLLGLGENAVTDLLTTVQIGSYRDLIDLYLLLASCLTDSSHTRTMDVLTNCSDQLLNLAFNRVKNESFVVNYLLTKMGLLKNESQNSIVTDHGQDLRGILLSLQHCVGQKYFPKSCSLILKQVLDCPPRGGDRLKTYHNDKAQLAGVLYRIVQ